MAVSGLTSSPGDLSLVYMAWATAMATASHFTSKGFPITSVSVPRGTKGLT